MIVIQKLHNVNDILSISDFNDMQMNPPGDYIFKVNYRNTRTKVWNMLKVDNKDTKTTHEPVNVGWEASFRKTLWYLEHNGTKFFIFVGHWKSNFWFVSPIFYWAQPELVCKNSEKVNIMISVKQKRYNQAIGTFFVIFSQTHSLIPQ